MADETAGMSGMMMLAVGGAVALVVLSVVSLLGLAVVGNVTDSIQSEGFDATEPVIGEWSPYDIDGDDPEEVIVRDSRGKAIALQGSENSYVRSDQDINLTTDETWTVSTWASVDDASQDKTMTALSVGGELAVVYNGTTDEWVAWYYQEDSRDSYRVAADAPTPDALSLVTVQHDGSTLSIHHNTTVGDTANTTDSNIADGSLEASNWHGVLEETRTFDSSLSSTERTQLYQDPLAPLPGTERTARLYYDEGEGSSTRVFIAGTSATVSNGNWVDGHEGTVLSAGEDYELDQDGQRIRALSGGALEGAPAVWIDYIGDSQISGLAGSIGSGFSMLAMSAIVIPAVVVLGMLIGAVYLIGKPGRGSSSDETRPWKGR